VRLFTVRENDYCDQKVRAYGTRAAYRDKIEADHPHLMSSNFDEGDIFNTVVYHLLRKRNGNTRYSGAPI